MADVSVLKQNVADLIAQSFKDGILGGQFRVVQSLREQGDAWYNVVILNVFCTDTERRLKEIDEKHMKPKMDIRAIRVYAERINGPSLYMGSDKLTEACVDFMTNCDAKNIEGCHKAKMMMTQEFDRLKAVFQKIIEIEREINVLSGAAPEPESPTSIFFANWAAQSAAGPSKTAPPTQDSDWSESPTSSTNSHLSDGCESDSSVNNSSVYD